MSEKCCFFYGNKNKTRVRCSNCIHYNPSIKYKDLNYCTKKLKKWRNE